MHTRNESRENPKKIIKDNKLEQTCRESKFFIPFAIWNIFEHNFLVNQWAVTHNFNIVLAELSARPTKKGLLEITQTQIPYTLRSW